MKTFIVLIPISGSVSDPRKACEHLENTVFNSDKELLPTEIIEKVMFELGVNTDHNILVYSISDFMDLVNDEQFNPDVYFMSYVCNKVLK